MNYFFKLCFLLMFSTQSFAYDTFYVYVKNETPYALIINKTIHVGPHKQHVLSSLQVSEDPFLPQMFHLKGTVQGVNPGRKYVKICDYDFTSHTILDSGKKEFQTFLFIERKGGKYTCEPLAAEVHHQSNTLKPGGLRLTIDDAYKRHKKWKNYVEDNVDPLVIIDPYTGVGRVFKPRIKRSN